MSVPNQNLFAEFAPTTKTDWVAKIEKYLKGRPITGLDWQIASLSIAPFLHADDFSKIILKFIEIDLKKESCISVICSSPIETEITIKEFFNLITKEYEFNGKIIYDKKFSDGQYSKTCDSQELLRYIPNFKFTKLESGIKSTIKHFKENFENIRK